MENCLKIFLIFLILFNLNYICSVINKPLKLENFSEKKKFNKISIYGMSEIGTLLSYFIDYENLVNRLILFDIAPDNSKKISKRINYPISDALSPNDQDCMKMLYSCGTSNYENINNSDIIIFSVALGKKLTFEIYKNILIRNLHHRLNNSVGISKVIFLLQTNDTVTEETYKNDNDLKFLEESMVHVYFYNNESMFKTVKEIITKLKSDLS